MSPDIIAAFAVLLTPLGAVGMLIVTLYRKRIADLEAVVRTCEERERRMLAVIMQGSEDEQDLAGKLARVISGASGEEPR